MPASDREAGAAAAARGGVRVLDLEGLADQVIDEVDLGPADIGKGDRIDQNRGAVALDDEIVLRTRLVEVEAILEPRAAAAGDADAKSRAAGLAGQDPRDPLRGTL